VRGVFTAAGGTELSLQRELRDDGRSICRADGRPVTLAALREQGDRLVNIHGQHDSQALLREDTHITYLDAFAGLQTEKYTEYYDAWNKLMAERRSLSMAEDEKRARIDILTHRINELRGLDLKPGEEKTLSARRKVLRGGEQIRGSLGAAYHALYGDEESQGACDLATEAVDAVSSAARIAPELGPLAERLSELQYALRDCAEDARIFFEGIGGSEEELENIESRLDAIGRLRRKHSMEPEAIAEAAVQWEAELESLILSDKRLAEIDEEIGRAEKILLAEAQKLTAGREKASRRLEERILGELTDLDMNKVRFSVERTQTEPGASGCDGIRFLIAANVGEPFKPLSRIASGGEMARIMLAIKNLLAEGDDVGTLVFDEVDSGVSGRAAQRVAQKLCAVSRRKQVLCVTHLPQIAAYADSHFHVEKEVEGGRTVTRVTKLDRAGRVEELAKITAGASVTEAARKAAEELLAQAEAFKMELT
jgi:DNA repair protein RecN (Recombination protein N)